MPREKKPPRLLLRKRPGRKAVFVVLDSGKELSTGCGPENREIAESKLAEYIGEKWEPPSGARRADEISVSEVLAIYGDGHARTVAAPERQTYALVPLIEWWGDQSISTIKGETCRRYARERDASDGTVRRELGVLRAALNFAHREGYLLEVPAVWQPDRPPSRDKWLTRDEIARIVWAAYRGRKAKHLARFILIAVYTGTRKSAALGLQWFPNTESGHVDINRGIIYRSSPQQRRTKKRQTPVPIPKGLLAHMKRWRCDTRRYVVEYGGLGVKDVKKAWARACVNAGVDHVPIHTLRHTAITWSMQRGASLSDASGYFGVSMATLEDVYYHHHPDHMKSAKEAMERKI